MSLLFKNFTLKLINFLTNYRKIIDNLSWLFFDKIIRLIIGIFISILFARKFGPNIFGEYNFVFAYVTFFSTIATLGFDTILIRDFIEFPRLEKWYLSTAIFLRVFAGLILYLSSILLIYFLRLDLQNAQILILIYGLSLVFNGFDIIDLWFQSQIKSKYSVISKLTIFILFSIIRVGLIYFNTKIIFLITLSLIEVFFSSIAIISIFYFKNSNFQISYPKSKIIFNLLKESWPAIISSFAIMIYMKIDQIMLPILASTKELGFYSVALKLSEIWYLIPTLFINTITPILISINITSPETFIKKFKIILYYSTMFAYIIAILMTYLSPFIIKYLYGNNFIHSASILSIHIWAAIFVFIGVISSPWYIINKSIEYTMINTIIGAIINILLNIYWIPKFGGIGAAYSTIVAYAFGAFILNAFYPKTRKIFKIQLRSLCLLKN